MKATSEEISYHKAAGQFLKNYYENNTAENIFSSYGFQSMAADEAMQIAKSMSIKKMGNENAIVATWFAFAGVKDISNEWTEISATLLDTFFNEINYPVEEREIVKVAISIAVENKFADTKAQKIVCDAINSRLAWPDFLENILLLKEEINRLTANERDELFYLKYYRDLFLKRRYYTKYANEKYSIQREKNFELLEKRIHKFETSEKTTLVNSANPQNVPVISSKETEDLFKIAFRNYNHLISVADSKAALLINVNAIIISVVLGLILSKIEKNIFLLFPTIVLFTVCLTTIFLAVLASRPQKNSFSEDKSSHTYQKFFFGSFDLIDRSFRRATWNDYYSQLHELFINTKESVYMEVFKESFNVRKVLSRKFNYLSIAYWVFMIGLLGSIIVFIISIKNNTFIS